MTIDFTSSRKTDFKYVVYDKKKDELILVKEIMKYIPENTEWLRYDDGIAWLGTRRRYDKNPRNFVWLGYL